MSRSEILTQSVKAIFAKKRKRLLEEDGGLNVFVGEGFTPPTVSFAVRESNALETIRRGALTQAEVLDRTGYVAAQDDKVFVGAFYRNRPGGEERGREMSRDEYEGPRGVRSSSYMTYLENRQRESPPERDQFSDAEEY